MPRNDGRSDNQLREIKFTRNWLNNAEGSVIVEFGNTRVLCVASFTPGAPRWLKDSGKGWVTSEYSMLPRATHTRSDRESVKGKLGGRTFPTFYYMNINCAFVKSRKSGSVVSLASYPPNRDDLTMRVAQTIALTNEVRAALTKWACVARGPRIRRTCFGSIAPTTSC